MRTFTLCIGATRTALAVERLQDEFLETFQCPVCWFALRFRTTADGRTVLTDHITTRHQDWLRSITREEP